TILLSVAAPENFTPLEWPQRKDQVSMVASSHRGSFKTKGIDQFLALAAQMPETKFNLIGGQDSWVLQQIQSRGLQNLQVTGFLPYHSPEFLQILNESKVAVQLSFYESFGAAIIDAGLCGCEMIVYNRGALPEVVGNQGQVVDYGDTEEL